MPDFKIKTPDELLEEIQQLIGDKETLAIHAPVETPDGQRVLVIWRRRLPDGNHTGERAVIGFDLDNVLRRVLQFEDDVQDVLEPGRAAERERRLREEE